MLFSALLIIVDVMWIMYICKYKKKIKSDYHIQYAHIGIKKKRNTFEFIAKILLYLIFFALNVFIVFFIVIKIYNITKNQEVL